ncbi:Calx-beta domain-containing protein [Candidatus Poriferisodalis sp.]|uniref:Calx-beta domain-containing protein n=1 Tax=Candidatus Poriferisodalis sp. TaxID=3101277 RepID=UPI003B01F4AF
MSDLVGWGRRRVRYVLAAFVAAVSVIGSPAAATAGMGDGSARHRAIGDFVPSAGQMQGQEFAWSATSPSDEPVSGTDTAEGAGDVDVVETVGGLAAIEEQYARDYGVSVAEASRRLARIDELKPVLRAIREASTGRVAGWGFDHVGMFGGWVLLAGDGLPSAAAAELEGAHRDVWVHTGAVHTYEELRAAQRGLFSGFDSAVAAESAWVKQMVSFTGIDMAANAVQVGIDPGLVAPGDLARLPGWSGGSPEELGGQVLFEAAAAAAAGVLGTLVAVRTVVVDGRGVAGEKAAGEGSRAVGALSDSADAEGGDSESERAADDAQRSVRGIPEVSLSVASGQDRIVAVDEGESLLQLVVSLTEAPDVAVSGTLTVSHVSTDENDFWGWHGHDLDALQYRWAVPAGESSAAVGIAISDDHLTEPDEQFKVALGTLPAGYIAGPSSTVEAKIVDDDIAYFSFGVSDLVAVEGSRSHVIKIAVETSAFISTGSALILVPTMHTDAAFRVLLDGYYSRTSQIRIPVDFGTREVNGIRFDKDLIIVLKPYDPEDEHEVPESAPVPSIVLEARSDADTTHDIYAVGQLFDLLYETPDGALKPVEDYGVIYEPRSPRSVVAVDTGAAPSASLSVARAQVAEGGSVDVTVTLSKAQSKPTAVKLSFLDGTAEGGRDYRRTAAVDVPPGRTSATRRIHTIDDDLMETDETFTVAIADNLKWARGATNHVTVTIIDDDHAKATLEAVSGRVISEKQGKAVVKVSLSRPLPHDVEIPLVLESRGAVIGSDFQAKSLRVVIRAGTTSGSAKAAVAVDDSDTEGPEKFAVKLGSLPDRVVRGRPGTVLFTIFDTGEAPTAQLSSARAVLREGTNVTVSVTLSEPLKTDTEVALTFSGTADADADYTVTGLRNGTAKLQLPAGKTRSRLFVTVIDDDKYEGTGRETIAVGLDLAGHALLAPAEDDSIVMRITDVNRFVAGGQLRTPIGDNKIALCTVGFAVYQPAHPPLRREAKYGVLTSGHCQPEKAATDTFSKFNGIELPLVAEWPDNLDVQWHSIPTGNDIRLTNRYMCNTRRGNRTFATTCEVHSTVADDDIKFTTDDMMGDYVCHYGHVTGYSCGTITDISFDPDGSRTNCSHGDKSCGADYARVEGPALCTAKGDSGGPWVKGPVAYGIHRGGSKDSSRDASTGQCMFDVKQIPGAHETVFATFLPIEKALSKLGLRLLTADQQIQ